ncbi:spermidine synthase [Streptomyces sp. NRRL F-5123]|uniref:spermidine synthase n=1 Tax=Streptomyces sp. NRRL F-5123 TaxID=1463856 RepID=UPI0004E0E147|nr:spermidine synthase [Streptomyces sp. NRRL F-5123]
MLDDDMLTVLDRREGVAGELALRHRGGAGTYEIIANGCFLMDTSDGRSERLLVDAAREALGAREAPGVLLGGLGVGFSLARAAEADWGRIAVVEREAAVVAWHRDGPLAAYSAGALDDPRVVLVLDDLLAHLRGGGEPYDALCLDIDNGPDWTVTENNGSLYSPSGLDACRNRLTPGGVLAVWSAQPSAAFEDTLRSAGFERVRTLEIPVARGVPDVVHLAHRAA